MIVLLLINVVVLYFAAPDRRYVLAALSLLMIELFTLSMMWLFNLSSLMAYGLGFALLMLGLVVLLLREDRHLQQENKSPQQPIEHTPLDNDSHYLAHKF